VDSNGVLALFFLRFSFGLVYVAFMDYFSSIWFLALTRLVWAQTNRSGTDSRLESSIEYELDYWR
jgi:hypothetical protein